MTRYLIAAAAGASAVWLAVRLLDLVGAASAAARPTAVPPEWWGQL